MKRENGNINKNRNGKGRFKLKRKKNYSLTDLLSSTGKIRIGTLGDGLVLVMALYGAVT